MIKAGVITVTAGLLATLGMMYATGTCVRGFCVHKEGDGPETRGRVTVSRVIDGDTIELGDGKNGRSGAGSTIRLADINAPELAGNECYAVEAKDALHRLTLGQDVEVVKDISALDIHGRDVRFVKVIKKDRAEKNILANIWMLENGYAWYVASENNQYQREMVQAQNDALAHRAGLWGACSDTERAAMGLGKIVVSASAPNATCTIKGNIADNGGDKRYFVEGCKNYTTTTVNTNAGEKYFCTEQEAQKAGWVKSGGCN
jgi:micrococcal nuclease